MALDELALMEERAHSVVADVEVPDVEVADVEAHTEVADERAHTEVATTYTK